MSTYSVISNKPLERQRLTYPWSYWDGVFDENELVILEQQLNSLQKVKAGTVSKDTKKGTDENPGIRMSNVSFVHYKDQPDFHWVFERFNHVIQTINDHHYNYDINGYESFQYTEYDAKYKGKYDWHMDMTLGITPDNMYQTRKLSLTFLVNEPGKDFKGGDFEINVSGEKSVEKVELKRGRAILFPSFMLHRVAPITKGVRKSIVIWAVGPKFV